MTSLYFRIKLNPNKNITLELKTLESDNYYYYSVEAYGYEEKPSDEEATKKSGYKLDLDIKTFKYEAIYQSGIYQFGESSNIINYIVIYFHVHDNLNYLSTIYNTVMSATTLVQYP